MLSRKSWSYLLFFTALLLFVTGFVRIIFDAEYFLGIINLLTSLIFSVLGARIRNELHDVKFLEKGKIQFFAVGCTFFILGNSSEKSSFFWVLGLVFILLSVYLQKNIIPTEEKN